MSVSDLFPPSPPLRHLSCVIVLYFMVIPDDKPRKVRMSCLQIFVRTVLGITVPIIGQGFGLPTMMLADVSAGCDITVGSVFVYVIPQMDHKIEIFSGHVTVGGIITVFKLLTGCKGESEIR